MLQIYANFPATFRYFYIQTREYDSQIKETYNNDKNTSLIHVF